MSSKFVLRETLYLFYLRDVFGKAWNLSKEKLNYGELNAKIISIREHKEVVVDMI